MGQNEKLNQPARIVTAAELLPAMSAEACEAARDGKVPALKTLLTNPATRAAIDQLFKVDGFSTVSILRLL